MVVEQMTRLELSYADLAAALTISEEQVKRLLRGESVMSMERMQQLAAATGLAITIQIERTE